MKRSILAFTALMMINFTSFSQELLESYVSPISKMTYATGDTIIIGSGGLLNQWSSNRRYSSVFEYQENGDYYSVIKEDQSNKKTVIEKIFSVKEHANNSFKNKVVFRVELENGSKLFVPIEAAIKSKEIVVYQNLLDTKDYSSFSNETTVILEIKEQGLSKESAMLSYIEKIDNEKFREWKADEFLYENEKEQYIARIDSLLGTVGIEDTMILVLPVSLNDYNFEKNTFPVANGVMQYGKRFSNLEFSNYEDYTSISVPKDRAQFFAATTEKSYKGKRSAYVILAVTIDDLKITEYVSSGMNVGSNKPQKKASYTLSILELHCVDNSALFYNYLGSTK